MDDNIDVNRLPPHNYCLPHVTLGMLRVVRILSGANTAGCWCMWAMIELAKCKTYSCEVRQKVAKEHLGPHEN